MTGANGITVREFRDSDAPAVRQLFCDGLMMIEPRAEFRPLWVDYMHLSLKGDMSDVSVNYCKSGGNFWVAESPDRSAIVGIVGLQLLEPSVGKIRHMFVASDYHRRGIGRLLMAEVEAWAKSHEFSEVILTASVENEAAVRFYTSLGLERVELPGVKLWDYMPLVKFVWRWS